MKFITNKLRYHGNVDSVATHIQICWFFKIFRQKKGISPTRIKMSMHMFNLFEILETISFIDMVITIKVANLCGVREHPHGSCDRL